MPLCKNPQYLHEPTPLQCGQAVLAMLSGETIESIIALTKTERETTLKDMFSALGVLGISVRRERVQAFCKSDLPPICMLSLETPRCWHWSLYMQGKFFDPEHGVLDDFPESDRKYYWEITGE